MLFRIILFIFAVFILSLSSYLLKKRVINFFFFLLSILIVIFLILFSYNPLISTFIANFFGVGRGVDFFVYVSILVLFFLYFKLYIKCYKFRKELSTLVEKLALEKIIKK